MSLKRDARLYYLIGAILCCFSLSLCIYPYFYLHQTSRAQILQSLDTEQIFTVTKFKENNWLYSVPTIPALNILGPPKCGTRTLIDMLSKYDNVIQFGSERAFWNGANVWRCNPKLNATQWTQYINDYDAGIQNLSTIVKFIQSHPKNKVCKVGMYLRFWNNENRFNISNRKQYSGYDNIDCIHPKYALKQYNSSLINDTLFTNKPHKYCYLIEKGPSQSRVAWVPIVYANLLPKTKLLTILRNPVYHVMSAYVALSGRGSRNSHSIIELKRNIIANINEKESFGVLNDICHQMNEKWNKLNNNGIIGIKRYLELKKSVYKQFIITYLRRKFIEPLDIVDQPRREIYIWAPYTFPVFLFALFSFDEVLNNKIGHQWTQINSYKVVQFEWLFSDVARSMKVIKCWMMDLDDIQCDKHISDRDNQDLFEIKVDKKNHVNNATDVHKEYAWYENNIHRLYDPCYDAMQNILFDRPKLLLGQWNSWNYTYTD